MFNIITLSPVDFSRVYDCFIIGRASLKKVEYIDHNTFKVYVRTWEKGVETSFTRQVDNGVRDYLLYGTHAERYHLEGDEAIANQHLDDFLGEYLEDYE